MAFREAVACESCGKELNGRTRKAGALCDRCEKFERIMDEAEYWDDLDNPPTQPERTEE